jgi:hypothetical protein
MPLYLVPPQCHSMQGPWQATKGHIEKLVGEKTLPILFRDCPVHVHQRWANFSATLYKK